MSRTRRNFSAKFKLELVIELLKGEKGSNTIATENNIQPNLLRNWKKEFLNKASKTYTLFTPLENRIGNQDRWRLKEICSENLELMNAGIVLRNNGKLPIFYKRNLDSDIESCIITLTEPTTPLIFHAQPGGIFLFVDYFMYQYPKQSLIIEQQM